MKCPESTASVRSAGSIASSASDSARGSSRPSLPASWNGASRHEPCGDLPLEPGPGAEAGAGDAGGEQRLRGGGRVADDGGVDRPVGAERLLVDVDLHDRGAAGDQRAVTRRPAGQRGAEGEDQVGLADQPRRDRRREPARDPDRPRRALEQAVPHRRGRQHGADRGPEALERLPRAGEHGAPARHDHGPARGRDQCGDLRDRPGRGRGPRRLGRHARPGAPGRRLRLDVERHVEHDGPALDARAPQGPRGVLGGARARVDALGHRAERGGEHRLVDGEVRADRGARRLPCEHEQRRPALRRLGQSGQRIGEARALVDAADADTAAHARVAVGHRDRAALVAGVVEGRARGVQRLRGDEVPAAQDAERVAHSERGERPPHGRRGIHARRLPWRHGHHRSPREARPLGSPRPRPPARRRGAHAARHGPPLGRRPRAPEHRDLVQRRRAPLARAREGARRPRAARHAPGGLRLRRRERDGLRRGRAASSRPATAGIRSLVSVQGSLAMFPIWKFGSRGAEGGVAAADGRRRRDRLLRADRARLRLRPGQHAHRAPSATATTGSSTAPRCGSPTAASPTSRWCGRRPRTTGSAASWSRRTRRASRPRTSTASSRCGRP